MILDLFSGCGGFSLGAHLAGFDVGMAVDIDPILSSSYHVNFPNTLHARLNLATATAAMLREPFGEGRPVGIIGGPPCQAFSDIGRRDVTDNRRDLVGHFFRIVSELGPAFFVMENVRGLGYSANLGVLNDGLARVSARYSIVGPVVLDAGDFGAPTRRKRLFVVGFDPKQMAPLDLSGLDAFRGDRITVKAAIGDLRGARLAHVDENERDWWTYGRVGRPSAYAQAARGKPPLALGSGGLFGLFSGHEKTVHTPEVVKRFESVSQGGVDKVGRHPRLSLDGQCPTLRAGTGSDRGSYQSVRPIHPLENRVITVREGARLQGFPDWFVFHPTVWHSFRMIGNSVSPPIASAILSWIREALPDAGRSSETLPIAAE